MSDKRRILAKVLWPTGILKALGRLAGPSLVVLNYHRVRSASRSATTFEEGVFGPSVAEFERQMQWVSRNTEPLTEGEIIERIERGKRFGSPSTLVTFDDGYVDNYETAFPILRKFALPAIFFIPTESISSRRLGWWDLIAYVVKQSTRRSISIEGEEVSLDDRDAAIRSLICSVKKGGRDPDRTLEQVARECGVAVPGVDVQGRELMTWDQIREVSRNGVSIGSHTHSHPILSSLRPELQREEFRRSKEILERELGMTVRSVAYPFGGIEHYDPESMSLASECGYEIGFTFHGRANRSGRVHRFGISRFEASDQFELMAASVLLPHVFAT